MSFFENTRKPVGLGGKIMVAMMNFGHSAMAAVSYTHLDVYKRQDRGHPRLVQFPSSAQPSQCDVSCWHLLSISIIMDENVWNKMKDTGA